jgi:hypothetical protein
MFQSQKSHVSNAPPTGPVVKRQRRINLAQLRTPDRKNVKCQTTARVLKSADSKEKDQSGVHDGAVRADSASPPPKVLSQPRFEVFRNYTRADMVANRLSLWRQTRRLDFDAEAGPSGLQGSSSKSGKRRPSKADSRMSPQKRRRLAKDGLLPSDGHVSESSDEEAEKALQSPKKRRVFKIQPPSDSDASSHVTEASVFTRQSDDVVSSFMCAFIHICVFYNSLPSYVITCIVICTCSICILIHISNHTFSFLCITVGL